MACSAAKAPIDLSELLGLHTLQGLAPSRIAFARGTVFATCPPICVQVAKWYSPPRTKTGGPGGIEGVWASDVAEYKAKNKVATCKNFIFCLWSVMRFLSADCSTRRAYQVK